MNWEDAVLFGTGVVPGGQVPAVSATYALKGRLPTKTEAAATAAGGIAVDIAMYKWLGKTYIELKQYMFANAFVNVKKSADLGRVVPRTWVRAAIGMGRMAFRAVPYVTVYSAGRAGVAYAQKHDAPGLLSTTHKQTKENRTTRSGGVRNPISGV